MNERYRWNDDNSRDRDDRQRRDLEHRAESSWRGEDYGRYHGDRNHDRSHDREHGRDHGRSNFERRAEQAGRWVHDKLDTSDRQNRAESYQPNRAWEGRGEPYPKDLGGINRPGQADRFTRDPLLGHGRDERGFRGGEERTFDGGTRNDRQFGGDYNRDEARRSHRGEHEVYGQQRGGGRDDYGARGQGLNQNRYSEVPTSYGQPGAQGGEYGRGQYGSTYGGQNDREQRDYSHQAYDRDGMNRYVEGGYETREGHNEDHRFRNDRDRDMRHGRDHDEDDRSWWRKARDEFNAWMGDREAEERRRRDHYHTREEPGRTHYGSQTRDDIRSRDDDTAWRDPMQAGQPDWRDNDRHEREEPRDHRPGWFRDDRGGGRHW